MITITSGNLTPAHFEAVGAPIETLMIGTEGRTEFTKSITDGSHTLDVEASRDDIVAAGQELIKRHPEIGALVLECTNMGPHLQDLNLALGVPVFDIVSLLTWFHAGLKPRRFLP